MTAHVHAALMALYAQDAAETDRPWERWEFLYHDSWLPCVHSPDWSRNAQYRRKPRTHIVNGFEVPEPMREAPEYRSEYWIAHPTLSRWFGESSWTGDAMDRIWLERGLCHATKEAAIANAKAMCGVKP